MKNCCLAKLRGQNAQWLVAVPKIILAEAKEIFENVRIPEDLDSIEL
jgi:hypothetical protein